MRDLNLMEMEQIEGGDCSNWSNGMRTGSAITWAVASLFVVSTGGLGLWIVAGAFIAGGYYGCM